MAKQKQWASLSQPRRRRSKHGVKLQESEAWRDRARTLSQLRNSKSTSRVLSSDEEEARTTRKSSSSTARSYAAKMAMLGISGGGKNENGASGSGKSSFRTPSAKRQMTTPPTTARRRDRKTQFQEIFGTAVSDNSGLTPAPKAACGQENAFSEEQLKSMEDAFKKYGEAQKSAEQVKNQQQDLSKEDAQRNVAAE